MLLPDSLIALILLSISPSAAEPQWPHNLPKHVKYFPEDEVHVKRGISIQERLQREKPIGLKKMTADEGEMFFLDNWIFASDLENNKKRSETEQFLNGSMNAFSPLRPHAEKNIFDSVRRFNPRSSLFARDFQCPSGTTSCSSIGEPNSCCGTDDTCMRVDDTGFGSVGCCPKGQTCAGSISCDEKNGYSSCPDSPNGGCCLPGYSCQDVGCVAAGTSITFVQPSTSTPRPTSTAVVVVPTTPSPTPTPSSTSSYTCSSGWFSCPVSLGGGCCQNGRECATGASCPAPSSSSAESTGTPNAPVRPTSGSAEPTTEAQSSLGPTESLCPTGFYVCSAYYPSGCCRVGRDCQTSGSCAPTASETIVNSNGVVVVAPTGASFSRPIGSCATGWSSCAPSQGGNCCPNGYACGEQCTATSGGNTDITNKMPPSTASSFSYMSICGMISGALAIGISMIIF
ncbi:hypothetical protein BU24DRAFT_457446 [Aaosphaeria arxii CBS 175.79]|uniref:GPI anchored protein n=1 Tax=Aaosphaeria arxii CBS 175.79 TaxID=1450172 RepID=A0A6A5Y8X1_9PLEO|nr:uncharacterized protein BU24DRAFT_457446 [Aaosphaeria arxii CBS 175.79]KAF2021467.1 hypothetical protein BU24DRAFT_457446 [Aaosphaeria arxii CBS 175.79]